MPITVGGDSKEVHCHSSSKQHKQIMSEFGRKEQLRYDRPPSAATEHFLARFVIKQEETDHAVGLGI